MMQAIYDTIEARLPQAIALLERLCAQPSISAEGRGVNEMADLLLTVLAERGIEGRALDTGGGPPVVYAEIPGRSGPTVLLYNHYDVQPVDPLEQWESPPFEPSQREGKLYARGVSDNKGDLVARLEAIAAFQAVRGELPVTVKLLWEGEEESGSPHFPAFVERHADLLAADVCLSEGSHPDRAGRPRLILGVKGLLYVEVEAHAARIDAHSQYAPVVPSAAWKLVQALNTLRDATGRVLIAGFYDDVRPLTEGERAAIAALPEASGEVKEALGLASFLDGLEGTEWWVRLLDSPTANLCGVLTGYTGPGPKTVLPCTARAKMDFRLIPNQRPEDILEKLRRHLQQHGFGDLQVTCLGAEAPQRTPLDDPFVARAARAAREFYGTEPLLVPSVAGTAPMAPLAETLHLPVLFAPGGTGYEGSQIHAPNEHIRLSDLAPAIQVTALLLERLGSPAG
jgi:acetylornithine deacetylase/succinyl-diaminopimelate desuccinylase-like protein